MKNQYVIIRESIKEFSSLELQFSIIESEKENKSRGRTANTPKLDREPIMSTLCVDAINYSKF